MQDLNAPYPASVWPVDSALLTGPRFGYSRSLRMDENKEVASALIVVTEQKNGLSVQIRSVWRYSGPH